MCRHRTSANTASTRVESKDSSQKKDTKLQRKNRNLFVKLIRQVKCKGQVVNGGGGGGAVGWWLGGGMV